jgi:hypothetical protein
MPSLLTLTSLTHALLSLGHTLKGSSQFAHPSLSSIPPALRTASKIGWYEGSIWFLIAAVLNYKWSVNGGLKDGADRLVAGMVVMILGGAGGAVSSFLSFLCFCVGFGKVA